jgi:hypothetical protein
MALFFLRQQSRVAKPACTVGDGSGTATASSGAKRSNGGLEYSAATRFMAVICHRNSANGMLGTAFDNHADSMAWQRATALIADVSHGNAIDSKPGRSYADDFSAMRGRVIEPDDVRHCQDSFDGPVPLAIKDGGTVGSGCSTCFTRRQTVLALSSEGVPFRRSMNDKLRLTIAGGIATPCWNRRVLPWTSGSGHCQ